MNYQLIIDKNPAIIIANTDPSAKSGSHWILFYFDNNGNVEYFDSLGKTLTHYCYIVGLGPNCKFIDLLFKRLVITFIKINFLNCFIVLEIIFSQTDTLTEELMYLR